MNGEAADTVLQFAQLVAESLKGVTLSPDRRKLRTIEQACKVMRDMLETMERAGYTADKAREILHFAKTMERLASSMRELAVLQPKKRRWVAKSQEA